jgi:hypothetical protein
MVVVRGPSVGRGGLMPLIMVVVRDPSIGRGGLRGLSIRCYIVVVWVLYCFVCRLKWFLYGCILLVYSFIWFYTVLYGFYKVLYWFYKV